MNEVEIKDFYLKKSKLKNGVIEVDYTLNVVNDGTIRHPVIHDQIEMPHPDLMKSIETFHDYLLKSWDLKAKDSSVEVTGVDVSGKDDMRGLIITGKKRVTSGAVAMNSPRIRFASTAFGFEEEVESLYNDHLKEIFAALYQGKAAQLSIGFPNEGADAKD